MNDENNEAHSLADVDGHETEDNHSAELAVASSGSFILKHEKPKLPSFHGDVGKHLIFRDDFKHAVENHRNARDSIAILNSCLGPERAKFMEGISSDLKAAWKYLDQNYGDRRVISDTVTADMERFKPTQPGKDHHFCDLVYLVKQSFNILKKVKRPQDINIISLIERKLTRDDLKICACHINSRKLDTPMHNLHSWMENKMTARLCSGATIQKAGASPCLTVHLIGSNCPVEERGQVSGVTEGLLDRRGKKSKCCVTFVKGIIMSNYVHDFLP